MNACCILPPYGFSKDRHKLPSSPNVVMSDLKDTLQPPQLRYPTGFGAAQFDARISQAEWSQLEAEVIQKLDSAWATGGPVRLTLVFNKSGCNYAVFCWSCFLISNILCFVGRDDCLETAKTGRQLNVMYDVLARYNATHFHPRLMNARLYVKEDIKPVEFWNSGQQGEAGHMDFCNLRGHTLVVAIHIASTEEEFLALPRPVVGVDAGYPNAIGNFMCIPCPRGGLCCFYPCLDYQLDGPRTPQVTAVPVGTAEGQYALVPVTTEHTVPVTAAQPGYVYSPPAVQMVDHCAPPTAQKIEYR